MLPPIEISNGFYKDEVQLVQAPIAVLTPLWLQDLGAIAEQANLLLVFDVYERTSDFLDDWLRQILAGDYNAIFLALAALIAILIAVRRCRFAH